MIVIIKNSTDEYVPGLRGTTMDFKKNDNKLWIALKGEHNSKLVEQSLEIFVH